MEKNVSNTKDKADLVAAVAEATGVSKSQVDEILTETFGTIRGWAAGGSTVSFPGFGKFEEKIRAARAGRNPATGESIQIPEKRSLTFKAGKAKAA